MSGVQPEHGATPVGDLDTLQSLLGDVNFHPGTGGLADVTINIPAKDTNESAGTNFVLSARDGTGAWGVLQSSATRPTRLTGSHAYTHGGTFYVKVNFDRGGPAIRSGNTTAPASTVTRDQKNTITLK